MRSFLYEQKYGALINEMIKNIRKNSVYFTGPNCTILIEELCKKMTLKPGLRILDMGCGAGFTSIILAKEFDVMVFANDLWFKATDNYKRFVKAGVSDKVFPIQAEAHNLPYADNFFDAVISIDSYHYYGTDECYLGDHFAKLVKKGGQFGIVNPGLTREFENGLPEALKPLWEPNMYSWHSAEWWKKLWDKSSLVDVTYANEISDGKEIWRASADKELHNADKEQYLTLVMMTAVKK
jgi:cyclopropane fatty-acyl-phospholipid synthase-like methyltransferase